MLPCYALRRSRVRPQCIVVCIVFYFFGLLFVYTGLQQDNAKGNRTRPSRASKRLFALPTYSGRLFIVFTVQCADALY